MSGRNPPSYCTLTLIAMQGHQQKGRQNNTSSNNKDKSNTIIETSTAEDHDDENLHNPETVQDAVIHLEVDEEQWAITQGSKRQARWVWSPRTMSGLRLPDTPHAQHHTTIHAFRPETKEGVSARLLLFLTFSVLVGNPKKTLFYTVANPARDLLNREKNK